MPFPKVKSHGLASCFNCQDLADDPTIADAVLDRLVHTAHRPACSLPTPERGPPKDEAASAPSSTQPAETPTRVEAMRTKIKAGGHALPAAQTTARTGVRTDQTGAWIPPNKHATPQQTPPQACATSTRYDNLDRLLESSKKAFRRAVVRYAGLVRAHGRGKFLQGLGRLIAAQRMPEQVSAVEQQRARRSRGRFPWPRAFRAAVRSCDRQDGNRRSRRPSLWRPAGPRLWRRRPAPGGWLRFAGTPCPAAVRARIASWGWRRKSVGRSKPCR
jgi:hypothetical protein